MLEPAHLPPIEDDPLVSVLIANYNYASYLEEAIDSVLQQDYPNLEIIICDDGSTDRSGAILRSYEEMKDSRVVVVKKENGGMASAYNMAFQNCLGDIICFLDSDDLFYPRKITHCVQTFRRNPKAGFLIHRLDKMNAQNRKIGQLPFAPTLPSGWYGDHVISTGSAPHGFPVTSGLVLRREVAHRIFPICERIRYDLDEIIRRLVLLTTNVISIESSLAVYRVHGKNMTSLNVIDRLKKNLPVYKTMWEETKTYLETISPEDLQQFPKLEQDVHHLLMNYVIKRIDDNSRVSRTYWEKIKKSKGFQSWSAVRKGFWHIAIHMPELLFNWFVMLYWNTGGIKLQISRVFSR